MLKIDCQSVGMLQVNTYFVWDDVSLEAYIIDPGDEADVIVSRVKSLGVKPVAILLTHGHVDHISAVPAVSKALSVPVYLHGEELGLYHSPDNALDPWVPVAKDLPATIQEPPLATGLDMQVIHTPGHTLGGVCYYFPGDKVLFSGDTLFQNSIGRTDFPGGNHEVLLESISGKLMTLPDHIQVYPGHGPATTIGDEKRTNPYIQ